MKRIILGILLLASASFAAEWKQQLERELPLMGHRKWVVVADSAIPPRAPDQRVNERS